VCCAMGYTCVVHALMLSRFPGAAHLVFPYSLSPAKEGIMAEEGMLSPACSPLSTAYPPAGQGPVAQQVSQASAEC
jgi:hypothetical protein